MTAIDISRLSAQERLDLIGELWDSLDDAEIPVTIDQAAELDRRLAKADDDLADSISWETLRLELANRIR
jgi:putative addiction module component (TIGR02574 family)